MVKWDFNICFVRFAKRKQILWWFVLCKIKMVVVMINLEQPSTFRNYHFIGSAKLFFSHSGEKNNENWNLGFGFTCFFNLRWWKWICTMFKWRWATMEQRAWMAWLYTRRTSTHEASSSLMWFNLVSVWCPTTDFVNWSVTA